jgi:hypothetical protein
VRLGPFKLAFCHFQILLRKSVARAEVLGLRFVAGSPATGSGRREAEDRLETGPRDSGWPESPPEEVSQLGSGPSLTQER